MELISNVIVPWAIHQEVPLVLYIYMIYITSYLVNSKNIRYSGVTKLDQAEQWDIHHAKQSPDLNSYISE